MLLSAREKEVLKGVVQIIKDVLNPSKIILFGSRAKERHEKHTDFDIAIDADRPSLEEERKIQGQIETLAGLYKVDLVYLPQVDPKFKNIVLKTGKILYERRA